MTPPVVRVATDGDVPAIHRIYAHEVAHGVATYEWEVPTLDEMRDRWRGLIAAGYPFLVAELDGDVAGYAYASAYRARAGYRWTVEDSIYVHPDCRGRGIGRALLGALVDRCTTLGYRQMVAVVGDGGTASIALHEEAGFRVVARFPGLGRKHGRWLENVQMLRPLGDGDATAPEAPPLPDAG